MKKQIGSKSAVWSLLKNFLHLCWHQSFAFWYSRMFTQVCPRIKALCGGNLIAKPVNLGKPNHREIS